MERHRLTKRVALILGVMGAIAWWGGGVASPALAQNTEELFTPYRIAGLVQSSPGSISGLRSAPGILPSAGTADPSMVATGVRLVKQGQYAKAIALLEPYRAKDDFLALHALGVAYVRTQRNGEAYDILLRAHTLNPEVAGPLLPAALACARMAKRCDEYRRLAQEYLALGGKFRRLADKIANHQPYTLTLHRRF